MYAVKNYFQKSGDGKRRLSIHSSLSTFHYQLSTILCPMRGCGKYSPVKFKVTVQKM
jgi:hypothetical protein